jgi:hypothetical protein
MTPRLTPTADRIADRLWSAMRGARMPWTVADLVAMTGASDRYARRYVMALREAGYLEDRDPVRLSADGGVSGVYTARAYVMVSDTGPVAPILVGRDGSWSVRDPQAGSLTGAELRDLRHRLGLSLAAMARATGLGSTRTLRRYEAMARVPEVYAARVEALVSD